jgi:hypothetical protein
MSKGKGSSPGNQGETLNLTTTNLTNEIAQSSIIFEQTATSNDNQLLRLEACVSDDKKNQKEEGKDNT